jgi:hypothetical protein
MASYSQVLSTALQGVMCFRIVCTLHADDAAAQRSSAQFATSCTARSIAMISPNRTAVMAGFQIPLQVGVVWDGRAGL